jgi:ABC-type transport system involved in cytochrome bd biosynthesis fused ATPase/permease subunit
MFDKRDYGCEVIGLVVLTVLSALSHFWYIMIAIGVLLALSVIGVLLSRLFLRINRETLARLQESRNRRQTQISIDVA